MDLLPIITGKKLKRELTREELRAIARGAAEGSAPDYQLAALLMAVRLNGMTVRETGELTEEMAASGDMLSPDVGGYAVDKHSTGGVGDTTTLILAPLVAALGGKVLKMSGRGLGHTGGTIDKLESIPGFKAELPEDEFLRIVRKIGVAVVGQTRELAPADKRLYALRDVTGTVDSLPLIASSIMSKKLASGAHGIVLDVKYGNGSLMGSVEKAMELAWTMVGIGVRAGRDMEALVTNMDEPLGENVGNALEVKEAIDILAGRVKTGKLLAVSLALGARMLTISKIAENDEKAQEMLKNALESGAGLEKLSEMIAAQGGDARVCENTSLLPKAGVMIDVPAPSAGYVQGTDCQALGLCARGLGAGRARKEDKIDPAVGFVMRARIGGYIEKGTPLAQIHARDEDAAARAAEEITSAVQIGDEKRAPGKLIYTVL